MSLFSRLMWYTFFLLVAILELTTLVVSQWTVHSFEDRLTVQAQTSVGVLSRALRDSTLALKTTARRHAHGCPVYRTPSIPLSGTN